MIGAIALTAGFAANAGGAMAQEEKTTQTTVTGWNAQCASKSRSAGLVCSVEQGMYLANTNQQLAKISLRVPADTSKTEMVIQLPHGLHLPSGLRVQFDDSKVETHQIHTCDQNGCYVILKEASRSVVSMKGGTTVKLTFKNLGMGDIEVPMPLEGFTAAYKQAE